CGHRRLHALPTRRSSDLMEMVQFHPTGLLAGPHTRMTGTVLEEGLRGAGGYLLNGAKERFMPRYDPKAERATRDLVSRAMYSERSEEHTSELQSRENLVC